jgi:alpha-tubulin suppressor-like RCC1 family protein
VGRGVSRTARAREQRARLLDEQQPAFVAVTAGHDFGCVRTADGQVRSWGAHGIEHRGWLPTPLPAPAAAREIASAPGPDHACALLEDGTVACWGANDQGQLGLGDTRRRRSPERLPGRSDVVQLALGARHSRARRANGSDRYGQVGSATSRCHPRGPRVPVSARPGARVTALRRSFLAFFAGAGG